MRERMNFDSILLENITQQNDWGSELYSIEKIELPTNGIYNLKGQHDSCSYFLRMLIGLKIPIQGSYQINGHDVCQMSFEEFLPFRLEMGYSFDYGGLLSNRTILENVILGSQYHKLLSNKDADKRARNWMGEMGCSPYLDLRPFHVPGYVRKLACVVRSLLHYPRLLLLESPTTAVDLESSMRLINWLLDENKSGDLPCIYIYSADTNLETYCKSGDIILQQASLQLDKKGAAA